ncbi:hypothetical protein VTP01DRAFT_1980 [Rhizomucor pusillus]|uniref:uncharacterized protein n=1 Tax=Rhizomucor pusillus TaxID=4840 RepID=UPI00374350F4
MTATPSSHMAINAMSTENSSILETSQRMQELRVAEHNVNVNVGIPEYLKDGKLSYVEPKLRAECHADIAEKIMRFRLYRKTVEESKNFTADTHYDFPEAFLDILSALTQDSDESTSHLTTRINEILSPFQRNESYASVFADAIERAVKQVATRTKYGVSPKVLASLENGPSTIPSHLLLYRWEVTNISSFPPDLQNVIIQRRKLRQHMSETVTRAVESLPADQRLVILQNKHHRKAHTNEDPKSPEEIELEKERKRKKEEEKRIKEEEKRKREEERRQREEERRKREEEKRRRDEEKKKKEQSQLRLTSLFSKAPEEKQSSSLHGAGSELTKPNIFPPFYVKEHMTMASNWPPTKRSNNDLASMLASYETNPRVIPQVSSDSRNRFCNDLSSWGPHTTRKRGVKRKVDLRNLLLGPNISEHSIDIFSSQYIKMKLLQFTEDVRPAYYGTWTKISDSINGRRPFQRDDEIIDYDHNSEAEWEPEGEGEDIQSGDEDEEDLGVDMADPDDVGWLVPEGYLSEGEGVDSDEEVSSRVVSRPAVRPAKKYTAVRPVVIGPVFENDSDDERSFEDDGRNIHETKLLLDTCEGYDPFKVEAPAASANFNSGETSRSPAFTDQHASELMNIIEGKADAMPKLISEAKTNWLLKDVPKRQIEAKIKDLAVKEKRGSDTKPAWYAKSSV